MATEKLDHLTVSELGRLVDIVLVWRAYMVEVIGQDLADAYLSPAWSKLQQQLKSYAECVHNQVDRFISSWPNRDFNFTPQVK